MNTQGNSPPRQRLTRTQRSALQAQNAVQQPQAPLNPVQAPLTPPQGYRVNPPQQTPPSGPDFTRGQTPPGGPDFTQGQTAPGGPSYTRPVQNRPERQPYQPGSAPASAAQWYAPAPQNPGGGKKKAKKQPAAPKKKRSLKVQIITVLIVALIAAGGFYALSMSKTRAEIKPYADVFLPGVTVDGIDLSGKTWAEGSQLVWDHVNQKQNGWYVRLRNTRGDSNDITAQMLGISFDPSAALTEAWNVGHNLSGNVFAQKEQLQTVLGETHAFYSAEQSADTTQIDAILQTLSTAAYRAPQDAYLIGFDPDDAQNPFIYQAEVYGQQLNTTAAREQILTYVHNLESGEVLLEPEAIRPSVTVADLRGQYELLNCSQTPISSKSSEDRTQNIRTAFGKINGMVVENGKKFSFNSSVGRRTIENGFLPAVEYVYGQETLGVGGGVCQASTTVYLAAIQSGMTILSREPHSMAVSYTGYGKDATVNDTRGHEIDFTFKNESGGPIYIAAHVVSSRSNKKSLLCEVRIYGRSLEGKTYLLETVEEVVPKPEEPIYKEDKDHVYVTYIDEKPVTVKGRDGCKVDAYLTTYQGGAAIDRKKVSSDYYKEKADTVYTGTEIRGLN